MDSDLSVWLAQLPFWYIARALSYSYQSRNTICRLPSLWETTLPLNVRTVSPSSDDQLCLVQQFYQRRRRDLEGRQNETVTA